MKRILLGIFFNIKHPAQVLGSTQNRLKMAESDFNPRRPLRILSEDIDTTRFSMDAVAEMREMFPDQDDEVIGRFLIARNGNLEKASLLLRGHLEWKITNFPVLKSSCINEISKGKLYMHGTDKEGHPLLIWRVRMNNPRDRDVEEMARMVAWWVSIAVRACPPNKSKVTLLMDRSEYKQENSDIEFMRHLTPIFQA